MRIPTETPFANASRRLVSSLQPWPRRRGGARLQQNSTRRFAGPRFDADSERLFWQEQHIETLSTLKMALLFGTTGFLAFIALDVLNGRLSLSGVIGRLLIVLALGVR